MYQTESNGIVQIGIIGEDGLVNNQTFGTSTKTPTQGESNNYTYTNEILPAFKAHTGQDGYVDTATYAEYKAKYPEIFKSLISPEEWLNPGDPTAKKFLQTSSQAVTSGQPTSADISKAKQWLYANNGSQASIDRLSNDPDYVYFILAKIV
jgi:hypothetical protein